MKTKKGGKKTVGSPADLSRGEFLKAIRRRLGESQAQLAAALGVSLKAVQSYEQGWRKIPRRVMNQVLVLLALRRERDIGKIRCWQEKSCPAEVRDRCPSYTVARGCFCWFVAGKLCEEDDEHGTKCMECSVIRRLLEDA